MVIVAPLQLPYASIFMSPVEQEVIRQFTDSMAAFQELGLTLAVLFVVFIGLVTVCLFIVFNYRLRTTMAHRDETRAKVDEAESTRQDELLGKIVDMYSSFTAAIKENKEDMATAIFASNQAINKVTDVLKEVATTNKALDGRSSYNQTLLEKHDKQARDGIGDIIKAIERVEGKMDKAVDKLDSLAKDVETKFPTASEWDARIGEIKGELEEARKACEEAKRSTDEKPVVTLPPPDISPAPDQQQKAV